MQNLVFDSSCVNRKIDEDNQKQISEFNKNITDFALSLKEENIITEKHHLSLRFDEKIVIRRSSLGLLPNVQDPEWESEMSFSNLKSSSLYKISDNGFTATLNGGYRLCRTTRGLKLPGKYYWEFYFDKDLSKNGSHVRFGISTVKANMEYPIGFDNCGYCIIDLGGSIHNRKKKLNTPSFIMGDVIGLGFEINEKGFLHLWINNKYYGIIFDNIDINKRWFPSLSIYNGAVVKSQFSFSKKLHDGWTDANSHIIEPKKGKFTSSEIINWMHSSYFEDLDVDCLKAIDLALTPSRMMPY